MNEHEAPKTGTKVGKIWSQTFFTSLENSTQLAKLPPLSIVFDHLMGGICVKNVGIEPGQCIFEF